MKITDLYGNEVRIENLQLAFMQADDNRHVEHLHPELIDSVGSASRLLGGYLSKADRPTS